jgi:GT2 family glycosyltransferase
MDRTANDPPPTGALPSVSVIVPTKNRPEEIARMLRSLRAQSTLPLEVLVVDQSDPPYALEPFPELVHLHAPQLGGLTAARNFGVERARGDVFLFFDDDIVLRSDCVREIARAFALRPDVVGAQCAVHNPWDDAPLSLYDVSTRIFEHGFFNPRPKRRHNERVPRLIDGLASSYRRELFAHERFDEALPGYGLAEDWDFTKRASRHGALAYVASARVDHLHSPKNRHDAAAYARLRRRNILYLYDKLGAARDVRNRLWKRWWILGETLRGFRASRKAPLQS